DSGEVVCFGDGVDEDESGDDADAVGQAEHDGDDEGEDRVRRQRGRDAEAMPRLMSPRPTTIARPPVTRLIRGTRFCTSAPAPRVSTVSTVAYSVVHSPSSSWTRAGMTA